MKKILFLCGWYYPDSTGGTEKYVDCLAKKLSGKNFKVQVAAPAKDGKELKYINDGIEVYRYPVLLNSVQKKSGEKIYPKYTELFESWVKKNRPDIVHMHSFTGGCNLGQAKAIKEIDIPIIFTMHMSDLICKRGTMMRWGKIPCDGEIKINRCSACYLQKRGMPKLLIWAAAFVSCFTAGKFKKKINRLTTVLNIRDLICEKKRELEKFFKITDKVIVVSRWLYNAILINESIESKLSLARHGLEGKKDLKKKRSREDNSLKIGYLGRFNYVKGVHILVRAIKKLPKNIDIKLKIYGKANSQEEENYLQSLKKEKGVDSRIEFFGELKPGRQKDFFEEIDILAVPSLGFEAGPLVVLEAFSCGVPVMGSDVGGIDELVANRKNGILIRAGDVKRWSDQIKKLYLEPNLIKEMAKNTPKVKTMEEVARENINIYEKLFSKK